MVRVSTVPGRAERYGETTAGFFCAPARASLAASAFACAGLLGGVVMVALSLV